MLAISSHETMLATRVVMFIFHRVCSLGSYASKECSIAKKELFFKSGFTLSPCTDFGWRIFLWNTCQPRQNESYWLLYWHILLLPYNYWSLKSPCSSEVACGHSYQWLCFLYLCLQFYPGNFHKDQLWCHLEGQKLTSMFQLSLTFGNSLNIFLRPISEFPCIRKGLKK